MPRNSRDIISEQSEVFAFTNWTSDVALDCDSNTAAEIADVLATLCKVLIEKGIIKGSVSA